MDEERADHPASTYVRPSEYRALRIRAAELGISISALIRDLIRKELAAGVKTPPASPAPSQH